MDVTTRLFLRARLANGKSDCLQRIAQKQPTTTMEPLSRLNRLKREREEVLQDLKRQQEEANVLGQISLAQKQIRELKYGGARDKFGAAFMAVGRGMQAYRGWYPGYSSRVKTAIYGPSRQVVRKKRKKFKRVINKGGRRYVLVEELS